MPARRLVWISADGKTVDPIAEGDYYRPAYSPSRGLLAVIAADGQADAPDAGTLCVIDPHDTGGAACAPAPRGGRRVGRPAWAPNGRSLLVLAAGADGDYDQLLSFAPNGGDPTRGKRRPPAYRAARHPSPRRGSETTASPCWSPTAAADRRTCGCSPAAADGSFKQVKDFPSLTGSELAATGHFLALQRGTSATGDGPIVLLDANRAHPWLRRLTSGVNPAWAG